jgi:hypothetical protein
MNGAIRITFYRTTQKWHLNKFCGNAPFNANTRGFSRAKEQHYDILCGVHELG